MTPKSTFFTNWAKNPSEFLPKLGLEDIITATIQCPISRGTYLTAFAELLSAHLNCSSRELTAVSTEFFRRPMLLFETSYPRLMGDLVSSVVVETTFIVSVARF